MRSVPKYCTCLIVSSGEDDYYCDSSDKDCENFIIEQLLLGQSTRAQKAPEKAASGKLADSSRRRRRKHRERSQSSDNSLVVLYRGEAKLCSSPRSSSTTKKLQQQQQQAPALEARIGSIETQVSTESKAIAAAVSWAARGRLARASYKSKNKKAASGKEGENDRTSIDRRARASERQSPPRLAVVRKCEEQDVGEQNVFGSHPRSETANEKSGEVRKQRRHRAGASADKITARLFDAPEIVAPSQAASTESKKKRDVSKELQSSLGALVQQLYDKRSRAAGDNSVANANPKSERLFPFKPTRSGNLKILPNQVVFESKKVSVLVADPRHAKVNVKTKQGQLLVENHANCQAEPHLHQLRSSISTDYSSEQQQHNVHPGHSGDCRPRGHHSTWYPMQKKHNQQQQLPPPPPPPRGNMEVKKSPVAIENVPLSALGFTGEEPIDWKSVRLPEKTDLYKELARRITTYKNADCIVRIGQDEFHCHLLVLQSYSSFFDDKNVKEIDLSGSSVSPRVFALIYDWMISSSRESCQLLRRDNILEVFLAAQFFGIKELEEQCWAFIDNDELFCEDTAFLLYMEARKIGNTAVMELMVPRIMKFFLMLVSTKDFLELHVQELCMLLRSNYISVNSEMEVLMSAVRWLMHDWENRKQFLLEVMRCVRFGLIAPWQLVDVKRNPENPELMELMSYPEVQQMVDDGLAYVIIKYWYGDQTEDYYHWIDLLGLSEPTNRNWAGEDKHYVTYTEFLLYLEEYRNTKITELKNKKVVNNPLLVNSVLSPGRQEVPQGPPTKSRVNHQSAKAPQLPRTTSNLRPLKHMMDMPGNNAPHAALPGMMMPPEILAQYLTSMGRNGSKSGFTSVNKSRNPENANDVQRFQKGEPIRKLRQNHNVNEQKLEREKIKTGSKKQRENILQQGCKYLQSKWSSAQSSSSCSKFEAEKNERKRNESLKSEEEAATMIQAVYRGYTARRKYNEIRKAPSEDKHNTRRIAEPFATPLNRSKSLEAVKESSSSCLAGQGQHKREDKSARRSTEEFRPAAAPAFCPLNARRDGFVKSLPASAAKSDEEESSDSCTSGSSSVETVLSLESLNATRTSSSDATGTEDLCVCKANRRKHVP